MPKNADLGKAKMCKNDEFYTDYNDIQLEMNAYIEYNPNVFKDKTVLLPCDDPEWSNFTKFFAQNFENFGLKKLISTSYATESKNKATYGYQFSITDFVTDFEKNSMQYNEAITGKRGKIFILDKDRNKNGSIDINDLKWSYLEGDGDFRSEEVTKLRDEADIIVTNPPFSLSIPFILWIVEANKQFSIIGNQNSITYKDIFPLLKENRMWLGPSIHSGDREFRVPNNYELNAASNRIDEKGNKYIRVKGVRWFTNIEHGRRHEPISLMSIAENKKFSKHKEIRGVGYYNYDNYNGIDIPFSDAIPSDYDGIMGVPVTFMDKYCPEQFEIIGCGDYTGLYGSDDIGINRIGEEWIKVYRSQGGKGHYTANMKSLVFYDNEHKARNTFKRILIRRRRDNSED